MATIRPQLYLAGPEVFLPDAVAMGARKKRLCEQFGFEGLFPLDEDAAPALAIGEVDMRIYRACVASIRRADLAIFNLTPFRGVSADAGTVFELGLCVGLGKPVFAYSNSGRDLIDRVRDTGPVSRADEVGAWRDAGGSMVEDFGNVDNLMIDCALRAQGRTLHRRAAVDPLRDVDGFLACLKDAAAVQASGQMLAATTSS